MRYELRDQKPNSDYAYLDGFAIYDSVERKQVGWCKFRDRCEREVAEMNAREESG